MAEFNKISSSKQIWWNTRDEKRQAEWVEDLPVTTL